MMRFGHGNLQERVEQLERDYANLCRKYNEKGLRIAELEAENAKLKERLKLRPHDLMHRLDELEAERDEYYDGYQALMNRCAELTALVRDMSRDCRPCTYPCFNENGACRIYERIRESGIEVAE